MSIQINNLSHWYHRGTALETRALSGVSLTIDRGSWVCIVGHTGSGKSTLAQHLNGILLPSSGDVVVDGHRLTSESRGDNLRDVRRSVGLIFQYPEQQLFEETIRAELAFGPKNWGVPDDELEELTATALRQVGLDESFLDRNPFALSGGQKRRVAIASVLVSKPKYLVLDEPTAGLDGQGRQQLIDLLDRVHAQGTAIIHVTHDLDIAFSRADRILVMLRGEMKIWDEPAKVARWLKDNPTDGLLLPDIIQLELNLAERGLNFPLTSDPEELADAIKESLK